MLTDIKVPHHHDIVLYSLTSRLLARIYNKSLQICWKFFKKGVQIVHLQYFYF